MRTLGILLLSMLLIIGGSVSAEIHNIELRYLMGFSPTGTIVSPGDTVRWTVVSGTHQVVSDESSSKYFESLILIHSSDPFEVIFDISDGPGPFPYHCGFNPDDEKDTIFTAQTCYTVGDVNNDGYSLTVADHITLLRYLSGDIPSLEVPYQADLTGDCVIDSCDAQLYADYFVYGLQVFSTIPVPTCCYMIPCCVGIRGNVDNDPNEQIIISDLTYLVTHMFQGGPAPECYQEGDVDGIVGINISDLSYLVDYMFNGGPPPPTCPQDL
jgi:hypothetical protein